MISLLAVIPVFLGAVNDSDIIDFFRAIFLEAHYYFWLCDEERGFEGLRAFSLGFVAMWYNVL